MTVAAQAGPTVVDVVAITEQPEVMDDEVVVQDVVSELPEMLAGHDTNMSVTVVKEHPEVVAPPVTLQPVSTELETVEQLVGVGDKTAQETKKLVDV